MTAPRRSHRVRHWLVPPPPTLGGLLAEVLGFLWGEMPRSARLSVVALWLFGVALILPRDLWLASGTVGLVGSSLLTVAIDAHPWRRR